MNEFIRLTFVFSFISRALSQQVLTNIQFDCSNRLDGFWRDTRYCDVFHACHVGLQRRSYACPQNGDRFYFDDQTQRCEPVSASSVGCSSNQYFTQITVVTPPVGSQFSTQAPTEPWRIFAQSREQFTCANRPDGFYASRWCNVYYRCFDGIANSFICPLQAGGGRLWWTQHGSSQSVAEPSAQCVFPCETGRRCTSPGGIIVDNGNQISESQQEAESVYTRSSCSNQNSQTGNNFGQTGSNQATGGQQTGNVPCTVVQCGQTQTGGGQTGFPQPTFPQTGTGSSASSGNTGSLNVDSDVNCSGQPDGSFVGSRYCNVYHRCVSGTRIDLRCARATDTPYDLWWNPQTNLCDWPCRVQCTSQIYGSSTSAQQIREQSLRFFNNDCRGYPLIFHK